MMEPNTPRVGQEAPLSRVVEGIEVPAQCLFCGQVIQLRYRRTKRFCSDPLCANVGETPCYSIISEQGGKEDNLCW
jgi:hypothetical protein